MNDSVHNGDLSILVSVYLHGDRLDPDIISRELGMEPSEAWTKGQIARRTTGSSTRKTGMWSREFSSDSQDVEVHISGLMDEFGDATELPNLPGVESAYLDVLILIPKLEPDTGETTLQLSAVCLSKIKTLGVDLQITYGHLRGS
jgi:Domain of unknown function (DUF4279)